MESGADSHIGPYRLLRKLGEGGMGVVYAAEDERLRRAVAIKTIREASRDATSSERFFREARAAASLSHPNVCQLFDIGDHEGRPFLVMELLEGESLADRLRRGALPVPDASGITLTTLLALEALHTRGFVHRDLKPSNIFLTEHGVKLLDFGLVRELQQGAVSDESPTVRVTSDPLTLAGMIVGTPRYMAPEQLLGRPVDGRADLFAAGAILFEMVSGKPPFEGEQVMQLFHAVVYEQPPNLGGSAAIAALNRVVHRAMAKESSDRYPSAASMANDLREVLLISDVASPITARRVTRLIVPPFRVLRADPESDFLAQAIPDAITSSLASLGSIVVRSPLLAAKAEGDLKKLAHEADVDVALIGTMLRGGDQIRVTTQLVEVPGGTVIASGNTTGSLSDLFALQDGITERIVESLALPLVDREQRLERRDVPATPRAHEYYLRAGQRGQSPEEWTIARDLYLRAVEEDSRYAPAWARLARIHLLLGKYTGDTARQYEACEAALRRALEINPELPIAHHVFAQLEVATGRAQDAMLRLLDRVESGTNDPDVFAGLVMAARYCGLLELSAAAHDQARRLDPAISTSAQHTFWMMGAYDRALEAVDRERDFAGDEAFVYESLGRMDDVEVVFQDRLRRMNALGTRDTKQRLVLHAFHAALIRNAEEAMSIMKDFLDFPDPEGLYYVGRCFAHLDEPERALLVLDRAEQRGFFCFPILARDPWLDPLRARPEFTALLRRAEARTREAQRLVDRHAGSRVLAVG